MKKIREPCGIKLRFAEAMALVLSIAWNLFHYKQYLPIINESYFISALFGILFAFLHIALHTFSLYYSAGFPIFSGEYRICFSRLMAGYKPPVPVKLNVFLTALVFPSIFMGTFALIGQLMIPNPGWGFLLSLVLFFGAPNDLLLFLSLFPYRGTDAYVRADSKGASFILLNREDLRELYRE